MFCSPENERPEQTQACCLFGCAACAPRQLRRRGERVEDVWHAGAHPLAMNGTQCKGNPKKSAQIDYYALESSFGLRCRNTDGSQCFVVSLM
jgi:hypothetical protein